MWLQRDFLKEKLRVRERYWHPVLSLGCKDSSNVIVNETINCIIPDGLFLRIYLPLITFLVEREHENYTKLNSATHHRTKEKQRCCLWVLLESVVDWMDYRSISPVSTAVSIDLAPETPISHERSKIQKLIKNYGDTVKVFCDFSVREGVGSNCNEDEWDLMEYEKMSMSERSQNALFRAGRLLCQYGSNIDCKSSNYYILSGDKNFVQNFPEEDGIQVILMKDLFDVLCRVSNRDEIGRGKSWLSGDDLEYAKKLAIQCENDYILRNDPDRMSRKEMAVLETGVIEYWTESDVREGLRNKTLLKGKLNVTKDNIKEAIVFSGEKFGNNSSSLFINQANGYFNRALHEDIVIVQQLPKEQWSSPIGKKRLLHHQTDENYRVNANNTVNGVSLDALPPVPSGRVVAIAKEHRRHFVATMVDTPSNDESSCLVVPMDMRIPKVRIKTNGWRRFLGQRLWVHIENWEVGSNYPMGRCVEILGPIGDLETEITCLLKENQVELDPFSAAAQACLPLKGHDWRIPPREISQRKDLRSTRRIFSVDPNGCQDIDDTFHAHVLPNGDIEVGVHIADVTYFVPHDSALDKEAQKRATTFYLVDRRFDMLPSVLSSNLCSLHGNVDRLAVSTIWTLSSDFKTIKSFWYGRTVICNCRKCLMRFNPNLYQGILQTLVERVVLILTPSFPFKNQ